MSKTPFIIIIVVCFITTSCSSSDEEAKMAADAYVASTNKFDVSSFKVSSHKDVEVSQMRISRNELLSEEEKKQASIELWRRYYLVSFGVNEDNICFKGDLYGYLYNNDEILKNLIDKSLDRFGHRYINKEFEKLVKTSDAYKHATSKGWCSPSNFKNNSVAKAAAIYCLSMDNKVRLDAINYLSVNLHGLDSEGIMNTKVDYICRFLTPTGDFVSIKEEKSMKLYVFKYYSYKQLLQLPTFYGLMNGLLGEVFEEEVSKYQRNTIDTIY